MIGCIAYSQGTEKTDKEIMHGFYATDIKGKVKLAAGLPPATLIKLYPQLKDTLEKIKKLVYFRSESNEGRFLFDMIEAKLAVGSLNYSKAIFLLKTSMGTHAHNVVDSLTCLSLLKECYVRTINYIRAYEANAKMESMWKRKPDSLYIYFGMNKSSLYAALNFMPEAIRERRLEFYKSYNPRDTIAWVSFYNDVGVYFNRVKNSDSAEYYFLKARNVLSTIRVPKDKQLFYDFFRSLIGGNLGLSYFNKGDVNKAVPLLLEDIYFSKKHGDRESAFNSYNLMVECCLKQGDKHAAKRNLDTAEALLRDYFRDIGQTIKFLLIKSKFYRSVGDHEKCNQYLTRYFDLKDSLAYIEKEQNLLNTEIAFKVEQKELEILEKNRILEQKRLDEARDKTYKAYSVAAFVLLLGIILILAMGNYFSKKREKELHVKNEKIKVQNAQIEHTLKEKEFLIREIHHRVKNNLQIITSMLSLQISKQEGAENESVLREAKQRISAIALTHQMLYQNANLSNIPVNDYIENLVRQIERSLPGSDIDVLTDLEPNDEKVNIDNAIPLGLMINELLTNSFKHAFPNNEKGIISISLRLADNMCIIRFADNGVGLPENFNFTEQKSMGMDLIHILAEQLDATLKIESKNGSSFELMIPSIKLFI